MQTAIVIVVLTLSAVYAARRIWISFHRGNSPCQCCHGCHLGADDRRKMKKNGICTKKNREIFADIKKKS